MKNKQEEVYSLCATFVDRFNLKTEWDAIHLCDSPVRKFVSELVALMNPKEEEPNV